MADRRRYGSADDLYPTTTGRARLLSEAEAEEDPTPVTVESRRPVRVDDGCFADRGGREQRAPTNTAGEEVALRCLTPVDWVQAEEAYWRAHPPGQLLAVAVHEPHGHAVLRPGPTEPSLRVPRPRRSPTPPPSTPASPPPLWRRRGSAANPRKASARKATTPSISTLRSRRGAAARGGGGGRSTLVGRLPLRYRVRRLWPPSSRPSIRRLAIGWRRSCPRARPHLAPTPGSRASSRAQRRGTVVAAATFVSSRLAPVADAAAAADPASSAIGMVGEGVALRLTHSGDEARACAADDHVRRPRRAGGVRAVAALRPGARRAQRDDRRPQRRPDASRTRCRPRGADGGDAASQLRWWEHADAHAVRRRRRRPRLRRRRRRRWRRSPAPGRADAVDAWRVARQRIVVGDGGDAVVRSCLHRAARPLPVRARRRVGGRPRRRRRPGLHAAVCRRRRHVSDAVGAPVTSDDADAVAGAGLLYDPEVPPTLLAVRRYRHRRAPLAGGDVLLHGANLRRTGPRLPRRRRRGSSEPFTRACSLRDTAAAAATGDAATAQRRRRPGERHAERIGGARADARARCERGCGRGGGARGGRTVWEQTDNLRRARGGARLERRVDTLVYFDPSAAPVISTYEPILAPPGGGTLTLPGSNFAPTGELRCEFGAVTVNASFVHERGHVRRAAGARQRGAGCRAWPASTMAPKSSGPWNSALQFTYQDADGRRRLVVVAQSGPHAAEEITIAGSNFAPTVSPAACSVN